MSRTANVAPDEALMRALMLFWRDGYHAVGTRKIEEVTGITRFTLQTRYGGKKALLLAALDHYLDLFDLYLLPPILTGELGDILAWIEERPVPEEMRHMLDHGCFQINAVLEFSHVDAEIAARATRYYDMMRAGFTEALARIVAAGGLKEGADPALLAELLHAQVIALNVGRKADGQNARAVAATKALVQSWAA